MPTKKRAARKAEKRAKAQAPPRRWRWVAPLLVVLVGCVAYCDSLNGPFIFDDDNSIRWNPAVLSFFPPANLPDKQDTVDGRPVLRLSFVLNYKTAEWNVAAYHVTNLLIHLGGGLLLYGIVRRNLSRRQFWSDRFEESAPWLAAAVATAWVVHPLNTEAVTYIVQRAESLAGFFYLLVIYCLIRQAEDDKPLAAWGIAGIVACLLGMGTKEIVATAPVVALLYDRTFLAGSFIEALRRRWAFYLGLMATWPIVAVVILDGARRRTVGFFLGISTTDYARTQLGVIAHYIRLAIWPVGLVFDYDDWPLVHRWAAVGWGWIVVALVLATAVALWKKPWLGFLGAWFFLILAPSSSIVPIVTEIAAEHRMYLSVAAPLTLALVGGWAVLRDRRVAPVIGGVLATALIGFYVVLCLARNAQYSTTIGMWQDAVDKRPNNPRAHFNLGFCWLRASTAILDSPGIDAASPPAQVRRDAQIAVDQFKITLAILPDYVEAIRFLGRTLTQAGDLDEADRYYTLSLRIHPRFAFEEYQERGTLRASRNQWPTAEADFLQAIRLRPGDAQTHYLLAVAYETNQDWPRARDEFARTLTLDPKNNLAAQHLEAVLHAMNGGETPG